MKQVTQEELHLNTSILNEATTTEEITANVDRQQQAGDQPTVPSGSGPDGTRRQEGSLGSAGMRDDDGELSNNGGLG